MQDFLRCNGCDISQLDITEHLLAVADPEIPRGSHPPSGFTPALGIHARPRGSHPFLGVLTPSDMMSPLWGLDGPAFVGRTTMRVRQKDILITSRTPKRDQSADCNFLICVDPCASVAYLSDTKKPTNG